MPTATTTTSAPPVVPYVPSGTYEPPAATMAFQVAAARSAGLSERDARMASRRRFYEKPVAEPPYDFSLVPYADRALGNNQSVVLDLSSPSAHDEWRRSVAELLQCSNEARWRQLSRLRSRKASGLGRPRTDQHENADGGKPLMLEYIADRLDTDDALVGFTVRTRAEGWLQGLIKTELVECAACGKRYH